MPKFLSFVLSMFTATVAMGQAGPPFRTDDPETPGNKNWENNLGWIGDRNPYEGYYSIPNFDFNYGLGDRIQLKYELPVAVHELRGSIDNAGEFTPPSQGHVDVGLGESLLGVKWRFYEHHPKKTQSAKKEPEPAEPNFSMGVYPQLSLNNPASSVRREVVLPGPQLLLPIVANARVGPLRVDGEAGYWFTNHNVPQSWIRGLIIGRDFTERTQAYVEIFDQQDANRVEGASKQRETTLGLGGRQALNRNKSVVLLLMGGRSFQKITSGSGQPSWIAYVGLQFLVGPRKEPGLVSP
jgi:hypothetical protein